MPELAGKPLIEHLKYKGQGVGLGPARAARASQPFTVAPYVTSSVNVMMYGKAHVAAGLAPAGVDSKPRRSGHLGPRQGPFSKDVGGFQNERPVWADFVLGLKSVIPAHRTRGSGLLQGL